MSIGVQTTNAALLALQTLGRLNEAGQSGQAGGAASAGSATDPSSPVTADTGAMGLGADGLGLTSASLDRAASITDAALSAGQSVSDLLAQMKTLAGQVRDGTASGADAESDFAGLLGQMKAAVSAGGFDGVNLLDGSALPSVTVGAGTGGQMSLSASNLSLGGPVIALGATATLSTPTAAAGVLNSIDASLANLGQTLDQLGGQSRQITAHASFVSRLSDVLSLGGDAAATPTSADGAKLMALQVQQQLSLQGGAIANAQPNVLLTLFK